MKIFIFERIRWKISFWKFYQIRENFQLWTDSVKKFHSENVLQNDYFFCVFNNLNKQITMEKTTISLVKIFTFHFEKLLQNDFFSFVFKNLNKQIQMKRTKIGSVKFFKFERIRSKNFILKKIPKMISFRLYSIIWINKSKWWKQQSDWWRFSTFILKNFSKMITSHLYSKI